MKKFKGFIKSLFIGLIIAIVIRLFFFQSYYINNIDMADTFYKGDFIFVNKLAFGARLPITPLSVPFSGAYNTGDAKLHSDIISLPYLRTPGYSSIKNNDLIVFNDPSYSDIPIDKKPELLSRIAAMPGDTFAIYNKHIYINKKEIPFPKKALFEYRLVTDGTDFNTDLAKNFECRNVSQVGNLRVFDFLIKKQNIKALEKEKFTVNIRELKHYSGNKVQFVFPKSRYFSWNKDFYGGLVIPKKGETVKLTIRNFDLYKRIIEIFEDNEVRIENDNIYINEQITEHYTFRQNYYFVLNDNRDDSKDSRHWGFVPESHIIGKASFIWFSKFPEGSIRTERIFSSAS